MLNAVLAHVDYFQDITLSKPTWIFFSFDDKNLHRRRKFVGERDFPTQNSYTGLVQCLGHSRDQKFVILLCTCQCKPRGGGSAGKGWGFDKF